MSVWKLVIIIIGSVVGAVFTLALVIMSILYTRNKNKKAEDKPKDGEDEELKNKGRIKHEL